MEIEPAALNHHKLSRTRRYLLDNRFTTTNNNYYTSGNSNTTRQGSLDGIFASRIRTRSPHQLNTSSSWKVEDPEHSDDNTNKNNDGNEDVKTIESVAGADFDDTSYCAEPSTTAKLNVSSPQNSTYLQTVDLPCKKEDDNTRGEHSPLSQHPSLNKQQQQERSPSPRTPALSASPQQTNSFSINRILRVEGRPNSPTLPKCSRLIGQQQTEGNKQKDKDGAEQDALLLSRRHRQTLSPSIKSSTPSPFSSSREHSMVSTCLPSPINHNDYIPPPTSSLRPQQPYLQHQQRRHQTSLSPLPQNHQIFGAIDNLDRYYASRNSNTTECQAIGCRQCHHSNNNNKLPSPDTLLRQKFHSPPLPINHFASETARHFDQLLVASMSYSKGKIYKYSKYCALISSKIFRFSSRHTVLTSNKCFFLHTDEFDKYYSRHREEQSNSLHPYHPPHHSSIRHPNHPTLRHNNNHQHKINGSFISPTITSNKSNKSHRHHHARTSTNGSGGKKRRRHRTAFTPTQLLGLENSFERGHYLVGDERKQLAVFLRLSETQIKVKNNFQY